MGHQCCPIPTAVFSNHTGYESYYVKDMTSDLEAYIGQWKKLGLSFDAVLAGYLASAAQIDITASFVNSFLKADGLFILDPVMGDNGALYAACSEYTLERMRTLVSLANVITPNLTEACFLTNNDYHRIISMPSGRRNEYIREIGRELSEMMCSSHSGSMRLPQNGNADCGAVKHVVISGIETEAYISNYVCTSAPDSEPDNGCFVRMHKAGRSRCGTGDVFSAVIAGSLLNGRPFTQSVSEAASFVKECIAVSDRLNTPLTDGVAFEKVIKRLLH